MPDVLYLLIILTKNALLIATTTWSHQTSGCQTRSRLKQKLAAKCGKTCMHHTSYMATPEENKIGTHSKFEWQVYFSAENLSGVNPMVMNYKIRHNKNWQVRYSLAWPDHFFCNYLWWQKNGKTRSGHARLHARVAMEETCSMCVC